MSSRNSVFDEVEAALLNSDCDPNEAGAQGLCALYAFAATELAGSPLAQVLAEAVTKAQVQSLLPLEYRKELRRVLARHSPGQGS